ncbi:MAG: hypothetical protein AAGJ10_09800 [Bacteroidota bacterium]
MFIGLGLLAPAVCAQASTSYSDLLTFFEEWRAFEQPPLLDGAPDYTAEAFDARHDMFLALRDQLHAMDTTGWSVPQQVDWHIVRAEMNGYDFNYRVLKPWARDPAFYQSIWMARSDVPAHEGPTHHAVTELWTYDFPLSPAEERRLIADLRIIPPLMQQAQRNLTGNARELWIAGIRNIRTQGTNLFIIRERAGDQASAELRAVLDESTAATAALVAWLEAEAASKDGPSGIGKDNYTWYQQNVHLVPLTWEEEVQLLKRELDRAWSSLALEEHRNRESPPMVAAATPEEMAAKNDEAIARFMAFLDEEEILTVTDYMEPALQAHRLPFVPEATRNFFYIGAHFDPLPLFTHFYHWLELARMDTEPHPSPIRGPSLYNIFDSRNEGTATGVEEMFMHAGLYDDSPRTREIVWILLAQRAARGLGSLYAHANLMTMEDAGRIHMDGTPRGWMETEEKLLLFEQHLYLRQPGYGTSYITGKYLLERTLGDYARLREDQEPPMRLKEFFDRLNAIDSIPISLARWEMTGLDDEIRALTAQE